MAKRTRKPKIKDRRHVGHIRWQARVLHPDAVTLAKVKPMRKTRGRLPKVLPLPEPADLVPWRYIKDPVKLLGFFFDALSDLNESVHPHSGDHLLTFTFTKGKQMEGLSACVQMLLTKKEAEANAMALAGDLRWVMRMLCCLLANKVLSHSRDVTILEIGPKT